MTPGVRGELDLYAALRGELVARKYRAGRHHTNNPAELFHDCVAYYAEFTDYEVSALYRAIPDANARGDVAFNDALEEHRAAVRALAAEERMYDAEAQRLDALSDQFRKQVFA